MSFNVPADIALGSPEFGKNVDASGGDVDLTVIFNGAPWVRRIFVGTGGNLTVRHIGDTADCTYNNVPGGSFVTGVFTKIVHATTTASGLVVEL